MAFLLTWASIAAEQDCPHPFPVGSTRPLAECCNLSTSTVCFQKKAWPCRTFTKLRYNAFGSGRWNIKWQSSQLSRPPSCQMCGRLLLVKSYHTAGRCAAPDCSCVYVLQHWECKNPASSCNQKSHIRRQSTRPYVCMYVCMYYSIENVKTEQAVVTRSLTFQSNQRMYVCTCVRVSLRAYVCTDWLVDGLVDWLIDFYNITASTWTLNVCRPYMKIIHENLKLT